jgi:glutathione S-transferase
MPIELHTWNTPNGCKISVALEEMGLAYDVPLLNRRVHVDEQLLRIHPVSWPRASSA